MSPLPVDEIGARPGAGRQPTGCGPVRSVGSSEAVPGVADHLVGRERVTRTEDLVAGYDGLDQITSETAPNGAVSYTYSPTAWDCGWPSAVAGGRPRATRCARCTTRVDDDGVAVRELAPGSGKWWSARRCSRAR